MKILVTGANGLIGHELINRLVQHHEVYALSRSALSISSPNLHHLTLDLTQLNNFNQLPDNVDVIYHLAQSKHFREFPEKALDIFTVNTLSTLKLLDYAQKTGCKKFIYASSGGVYGNAEKGFTEDQPLVNKEDLGFYLGTKFSSEILAENYMRLFDVIIARFFFVYGPRQKSSMLIPRLINNVRSKNPVQLQGKEGIKINPIYIDDVGEVLEKMMDLNGSHKINIGGAEELSIKEICDIIGEVVSVDPIFEYVDGEPKNLLGSVGKMQHIFGSPQTSFKEGIQKMIPLLVE